MSNFHFPLKVASEGVSFIGGFHMYWSGMNFPQQKAVLWLCLTAALSFLATCVIFFLVLVATNVVSV